MNMVRTHDDALRRRLRIGLIGFLTGIATALMLIGAQDAAKAQPLPTQVSTQR
jgi:hypothetical protein